MGSFRLYVRRKNYWWDDLCAGIAMVAFIGQTILLGLINARLREWLARNVIPLSKSINLASPNDLKGKVVVYYMNAIAFYLEDWFGITHSRMIILLTIR
jgi:hypothetical protein